MSWSLRDYRQQGQGDGQTPAAPPPTFADDEPLPTHAAYMAGIEAYEQDPDAGLPLWQRRSMREQGLVEASQWERWGMFVRRGITEV